MKLNVIFVLIIGIFYNLFGQKADNLQIVEEFFSQITISDSVNLEKPVYLGFGAVSNELKGFSVKELSKKLSVSFNDSIYPKFKIEQLDIRIVYADTSGVLKSAMKRKIDFELQGWFESAQKKITPVNLMKSYIDIVYYDNIPDLEKGSYTFIKGEIIELPLWEKLIEPVIIIGAVSTIVYLFFSVRS